jgi:hypothetical protein
MPAEALTADVSDVTETARRYGRVLLSRRMWRALAVATLTGAFMLLIAAAIAPVVIMLTTADANRGSYTALAFAVLLLLVVVAAMCALIVLYVRMLSALATGARRTTTALLSIVGTWLLIMAAGDIAVTLQPNSEFPLHFLGFGALIVHVLTALVLAVGPYELRRADDFTRRVFAEPRLGAGFVVEAARLLDFSDARALRGKGSGRIWRILALALLLEGAGFYTLMKWATRLSDAAERPLPALTVSRAVLVPGAVAVIAATLLLSFALIRLTLKGGRRLRVRARRAAIQPADKVVAEDVRPAVLFLRSFETEHVPLTGARLPWTLRGFDPGAEYGTLEEMIVLGMTYLGPVVAVADPSQPDAPVGAARWHLSDDEWQRFVETQISRARLIVVGVAETRGLWWEIEALKRSPGALSKTIFVSPPAATRDRDLLGRLAATITSSRAAGDVPALPPLDRHLVACALVGDSPGFFVTSELSEAAYYVALRTWLVTQGQAGEPFLRAHPPRLHSR